MKPSFFSMSARDTPMAPSLSSSDAHDGSTFVELKPLSAV
jgi:hypothetical protein